MVPGRNGFRNRCRGPVHVGGRKCLLFRSCPVVVALESVRQGRGVYWITDPQVWVVSGVVRVPGFKGMVPTTTD